MKTPITYYGGKQTLADTIIEMIPPHKIYVEPFFGGGAVFFKKPKSYLEVINDTNDMLINFYQAAQNNFEELQLLISQTLNSESQYMYAKDVWNKRIPAGSIEQAWAVWLVTNGSFAGSMHGGWKWSNGSSGSHTGVYVANKRNSFTKEVHDRLKHVQISCRDAIKVIPERDTEDTVFYLDPPYPGSYQGHYTGYTHTQLSELLDVLSNIKGKFILSNYWSQTLKYYILRQGWKFKKIPIVIKTSNLGISDPDKPRTRTEIIVYNFNTQKDLFS